MTENEAIKKVEEFGLYHAIGDLPHSALTVKAFGEAIKALKEIQQYRAIGTVEECQEAMEKQREKKPKIKVQNEELPCKVGDVVWNNDYGRPCSYTVAGFSFGKIDDEEKNDTEELQVYCQNSSGSIRIRFPISEIGKTIFCTKEEAESVLEILKGIEVERK